MVNEDSTSISPSLFLRDGALVGLVLFPAVLTLFRTSVDDAMIVVRFADNLIERSVWGYSSQGDGVTSPLWLLIVTFFRSLGLSAEWATSLPAVLFLWIASSLLYSRSRRISVLLVLIFSPALIVSSLMGLETALAFLLVVVALLLRQNFALLSLFSMPWVRPELVPMMVVLAFFRDVSWRRTVPVLLLSLCAVALFRWSMFGHFLPLATSAKPAELWHALRYIFVGSLFVGVFVFAMPSDALPSDGGERWKMAALFFIGLVGVAIGGGDWMPAFRLLVPLLPFSVLAMLQLRPKLLVLAASLWIVIGAFGWWIWGPDAYRNPAQRASHGTWLRQTLHQSWTIAAVDIGTLGQVHRGKTVDLGGLVDAEIAAFPGGHLKKSLPDGFLQIRNVDALLVHTDGHLDAEALQRNDLSSIQAFPVEMSALRQAKEAGFVAVASRRFSRSYAYILLLRPALAKELPD